MIRCNREMALKLPDVPVTSKGIPDLPLTETEKPQILTIFCCDLVMLLIYKKNAGKRLLIQILKSIPYLWSNYAVCVAIQ